MRALRNHATQLLDRNDENVSTLAQRGVDAVRDSSQLRREKAVRAAVTTVGYIRDESVKAVLIAAAAGAALVALFGLVMHSRQSG